MLFKSQHEYVCWWWLNTVSCSSSHRHIRTILIGSISWPADLRKSVVNCKDCLELQYPSLQRTTDLGLVVFESSWLVSIHNHCREWNDDTCSCSSICLVSASSHPVPVFQERRRSERGKHSCHQKTGNSGGQFKRGHLVVAR